MRRILLSCLVVAAALAVVVFLVGSFKASGNGDPTYTVELGNAFGLVTGEEFEIAGVPSGSISSISLDEKNLNALVKVSVSSGNPTFHTDATCESRPQSLIGEYFIDCNPGSKGTPVLRSGGLIPVSHTFSTIPADLLEDVMQMPYRERLTLIINELGAGVAGNPANLQSALERAVPALTQTDNLLSLLAQDSHTIQDLTATADSVITALANNGRNIRRFVVNANKTAVAAATQRTNLKATFQNLPGFLQQLRPDLADLGAAADANEPVLTNLNDSSGEIDTLFKTLVPFSRAAKPAIKSLGQASVTGHQAVVAAGPTVAALNQFAKPTPELAQNLSIVLHDLDTQSRAVEADPRSPGGKGYSGIEALLQYAFEQTNAIDYFGQFGHILAVDGFVNDCSPYQTPATVAASLKAYGSSFRQCYSWLGPNQPGVNERDPTDPTATIPDPGGSPPGEPGPTGSITTSDASAAPKAATRKGTSKAPATSQAQQTAPTSTIPSSGAGSAPAAPAAGGTTTAPAGTPAINLGAIGQLLNGVLGGTSSSSSGSSSGSGSSGGLGALLGGVLGNARSSRSASSNAASQTTSQQAEQLLNYLLAP
jgi:phospholipid/cholesterol/gamma-HCH transport system substrate-binding protein